VVEPGRTCLGDRYELGGLVAAGGMGQVWRGTDVLLGRPVAVKVLRSEFTGDSTFLARFRAEAQNAAALSHPHIACVFDYGETVAQDGSGETLAYLVMELVEGRPLNQVIRESGGLDTDTTLRILGQTAAGLAEAHRAGMVHRDVKPGNILVTPAGDVKITDFGIAWSARSVALTQTGQVLGTPQYLSPEQAEGRQASPASDVYALGLIGYECLTGRAAFDGENAVTIALKQVREEPAPLPDDLPSRVRTLIRRALAKDPSQRFVDGAAFLAAVEAVRAGRSIDPAPSTVVAPVVAGAAAAAPLTSTVPPRGPARGRRHRAPAGTSAARPPARRRRSRIAVVLLPLLGLLAGAGIAAMVLQGLAGNGNPPAEAAAQQEEDTGIVLDEKDFLGRPADEVAVQLAALGLTVNRETRQSADAEPGTVIDVQPSGERLEPGATVVIVVATEPDASGAGTGDSGSGGDTTAAVSGTPAESSAPPDDAATESEAPVDPSTGTDDGSEEPATGSSAPPSEEPTPSDPPTDSEEPTAPSTTAPASSASSSAAASSSADTGTAGSSSAGGSPPPGDGQGGGKD
jgi:eukaryotic-like serine/threonine-protein kinase